MIESSNTDNQLIPGQMKKVDMMNNAPIEAKNTNEVMHCI